MLVRVPPPIDLLLRTRGGISMWPSQVTKNTDLIDQIKARKKLYSDLKKLFKKIPMPTTDVSQALKSGLIEAGELEEIYNNLAKFLLADENHGRLILYLPFELFGGKNMCGQPDSLTKSYRSFTASYLASWRKLIGESDFRADYVDGDIPERLENVLGQLNLPHVRKAAHLIPEMLVRNVISKREIVEILNATQDEVLVYSILDTLPMLTDLGIFLEEDWDQLFNSLNSVLDASLLREYKNVPPSPPVCMAKKLKELAGPVNSEKISRLGEYLEFDMERIIRECESQGGKTARPSRVRWLIRERRGQCLEEYGKFLSLAILDDELTPEDITCLLTNNTDELAIIGLVCMRQLSAAISKTDFRKAQTIQKRFKKMLDSLWISCSPEVKDQISITMFHWLACGLIDERRIRELGIEVPLLDSFYQQCHLLNRDLDGLELILESIFREPSVLKLIYPACVFFGSRLKGYPLGQKSDLDAALIIKPGVSPNLVLAQNVFLKKIYNHPQIKGGIIEFRLVEDGARLRVKESPMADPILAGATVDETKAHLLLSGLWFGDGEEINKLYDKFLTGFLLPNNRYIRGDKVRDILLRLMESEALQYRLMHKGYSRFFSSEIRTPTKHSWPIDPSSTFWDPGYRRLATKLFICRVFLPELKIA